MSVRNVAMSLSFNGILHLKKLTFIRCTHADHKYIFAIDSVAIKFEEFNCYLFVIELDQSKKDERKSTLYSFHFNKLKVYSITFYCTNIQPHIYFPAS